MPHKPPIQPGETTDRYLARVQAEHAAGVDGNGGEGDEVKLPLSIQPIGGGVGMLVDADGVPVVGDDGMPILRSLDTAGGGSAPSFASTQAAQTQAEEAAVAAAELNREFVAEQNELNRLRDERAAKLGIARDIIAEREASARTARQQGVELAGEDPFRFTAQVRGRQVAAGTRTPSDIFRRELGQVGRFQAPDLEQFAGGQTAGELGVDIDALDSVIAKLGIDPGVPVGGPFGFGHGGIMDAGGATPTGGSQAVMVGEDPTGRGQEHPEIAILRPDGSVEFVPMAASAAKGGVFSAASLGGFASLFRNLRASVGIQSGTRGARREGGLTSGLRSRLGVVPEGFEPPQVTGEAPAFQALGSPLFLRRGARQALRSSDPDLSFQAAQQQARRLSRQIGALPAPFKIPVSFFAGLVPTEQNALISAYRLSGVPESDFRHLLAASQLSARPQAATAVG